ncbi:MAG: SLBB domain-containing protein [Kordiimonadaceae bacterium]|nr:SLBB domain-containing protein [Kordiimonadaceae bacterium]
MIERKNSVLKILSFFLVMQLVGISSLSAQGIDQNFFDQIKKETGSASDATNIRSPLDKAREEDYMNKLNEQLERRKNAGPSIIEYDYNQRLNSLEKTDNKKLEQFGYNIFDRFPLTDQIMTGTVPDSYKLGVGDDLIVNFKGSREEVISVKVDREGRLIIPSLNPINVSGMTLGEVKDALEAQVSESMIGTEAYISVATLRQISVLVAGEVENPSIVNTTSLSTPIEVLLHVGGVKKTGSLRNIILQRGEQKISVDLYDVIEGSSGELTNLQDGDRLIVPTIGATMAIYGNVIRPGIYEVPAGQSKISAREALSLAGGTIRTRGNAITHMRFDNDGRSNFEKLDLEADIASGEIIVVNLLENSEIGKVTLTGHVMTPGVRSVSSYSTVRDLIGSVKNLADNPYLLFGVIERTDELTRTRTLIPFNPQRVLFGNENINLIDEDKVVIYGSDDIEFLKSETIRNAVFTSEYLEVELLPNGEINKNYCEPVKNLASIIADTQSDRFATAIRAVFVRRESSQEQNKDKELILDQKELASIEEQRRQSILAVNASPTEQAIKQMNNGMDTGSKNERNMNNYSNCPRIYQDVDNLLSFTLEHVISVDGAVRLPGVFPITTDTSVDLLLSVAGGTSNDANMNRIEITSYKNQAKDGNLVMNWEYIDSSVSNLNNVTVNPGGGVRVSSVYTNFESGAVLLSGEFVEPGVYTIRKGEKLSSLIARAGGITDQAYPYGAIFTRDRVKTMQRQQMQQTAQRLQSAMVSASVKKNVDPNGAIALQRMINGMADQQFLGRVVIEADPVVLGLDPGKDIVLEAGDSLFMPKRPNFIVTVGDVLNPSALQFVPGKGVSSYLEEVGGFTRAADEDRVFVVYPNGVAKPISLASWGGDRNLSIPPGSAIVVPTDLSPYDTLTLVREIGDIFRNLAVSAASIAVLVRN